jgi:predicted dehydrogenase
MTMHRRDFLASAAGSLAAFSLLPEVLPAAPQRMPSGEAMPIAIIGIGRQGRQIVGELQSIEAVKIAAIVDSDPARLESGVRRSQGAEGFADHKALLDKRKDIKAVILATPTHTHKEIALDLIAAGIHVYCELPLAHTIDDCRAIAKAARASKSLFFAGLEGRCNPVYTLARTFYRSDSVRDLVSVHAQDHKKTSWRSPAQDPARDKAMNWRLDKDLSLGLAGELGVHQIDVIRWYTGDEPLKVMGQGAIRLHNDGREVADTVNLLFQLPKGVSFSYDATLANSYQGRHEILHGINAAIKLGWSHGWMFKEADAPTQGWEVYANRQQFHKDEGITLIAGATKLAEQGKLKDGIGLPYSSLWYALAEFVKCVTEGKAPIATAEEGARATIVAILANQAITQGKTIDIDPSLLKSL